MADPVADKDKFVPAFAMPVIAPPPASYASDAATYYGAVAGQCFLAFADVVIAPEDALPDDPNQPPAPPPDPKGLVITIPNPAGAMTDAAPFGTLFALIGGWLSYQRAAPDGSAVDLMPILPLPFATVTPAPSYAAPSGLDATKPWGVFVLRLWGMDYDKLAAAVGKEAACNAVYYLGVDEASAKAALEPLVKLHFRKDAYDVSIAKPEKPVFQDVVEEILGQAYSPAPSYATLVGDFLTALLNGATQLLVKGGASIGQAVQVPDSSVTTGTPPPVGRVELWFLDGSEPPRFISPYPFFKGAPGYDF
ncbi:MAG TPA: hypothetical protein VF603_02015 [Allosphingosinicella sp.]|jgi:hypothetical protein